ncbi:MAG: sodium:solute symporter family protein [Flavobacteriales bacterium]
MVLSFVIIYLLFTIAIGIFANRYVKNSSDFMLAGKQLPMFVSASALFATWFGAETILGSSSEFVQHGLLGVIEDPFGAALCLLLIGFFFARPLYRMNLVSFGDFYKVKYGNTTEWMASFILIISYFGWIAAQLVALGILFHQVADIDTSTGIIIGACIVTLYTIIGGMWAVALTDTIQTIAIIVSLIIIAILLTQKTEGFSSVIENTPDGFYRFTPKEPSAWLAYLATWIMIGFGSIPQQDVFQRVMSSKSEKVAVQSSIWAGWMYLTIGLLPLYIGLCAYQIDPLAVHNKTQGFLPYAIEQHSGTFIQILFFGAMISAILSTASGAILAPSTILSENILRKFFKNINDKQLLLSARISVLLIAAISLVMSFYESDIYDLVAGSSEITLVSLFVPMLAGLYFKKTSERAAMVSIVFGLAVWLILKINDVDISRALYGFAASWVGWLIGIYFPADRADFRRFFQR